MKIKTGTLAGLMLALCTHVMAVPVGFRDHGTYLTDTNTGLDWLDVTISAGQSYNYVASQFGAGGVYEGWRYATTGEFDALVSNWRGLATPITSNVFSPPVVAPEGEIDSLVSALGSTLDAKWVAEYGMSFDAYLGVPEGSGLDYTNGFIGFNTDVAIPERWVVSLWDDDRTATSPDWSLNFYWLRDPGSFDADQGSFLVRTTAAPEPATLALLGFYVAGLCFARRSCNAPLSPAPEEVRQVRM